MASWSELAEAAPALAAELRSRISQSRYSLLGTLRAGGSPRISGVVTRFSDGEIWLTMKPASAMAADLSRDPRCALHSGPTAHEAPPSDAKLSGRANRVSDPSKLDRLMPSLRHRPAANVVVFTLDVTEAAMIRLSEEDNQHIIDSWQAGAEGTQQRRR